MTKKTRFIILLICVALFLMFAPCLVLYSLGYRIDFSTMKIVATGGIYIKAEPTGTATTIDKKPITSKGFFNDYVFMQNLLPGPHSVTITKKDYFDYKKTLVVLGKQVTKLEHVLLFKKNIAFQEVAKSATATPEEQFALLNKTPDDIFILKNNSLYYALVPENTKLASAQKTTPLVKNVVSFTVTGNSLVWLGSDGLLHKSNLQNNLIATGETEVLSKIPIPINKTTTYTIKTTNHDFFLLKNSEGYKLNIKTGGFEAFQIPLNSMSTSPDGRQMVFYGKGQLWYSTIINGEIGKKTLIENFSGTANNIIWLNNEYVILSFENRVVISEIDARGNVNSIILPQTISLQEKTITIKNPKVFWDASEKKLYILNGEDLIVSEKLVP